MTINFDNHSVDLPCPGCGEKVPEKIGRLKQNPTLTCPACGASITVDADQFRQVEKSINAQLSKAFKNLGKR